METDQRLPKKLPEKDLGRSREAVLVCARLMFISLSLLEER